MRDRIRYISVLGILFITVAVAQSVLKLTRGGALVEVTIDFLLISLTGLLFLYVSSWLSSSEIDIDLYPRIACWCLAGLGVLGVFLGLRYVHPGVTTTFSFGTRAIALAIGSIAGLGIGILDARAITRERELERRNTELRRTKEQLERQNDELSEIRSELEGVVQHVEASNERLEQFASVASHDLQEPLRMITSYLQLLERRYADELDDDAREFVDFAVDGAERMSDMIDGLLDYSRVDTRGQPFEAVDLETVLSDVCTNLQVKIEETDAEITIGDLPHVHGDGDQLMQLFQNLLNNAITYSDGRPRVTVEAERADTDERGDVNWVIISVHDEGVGIEPTDQERIFDIFNRLHTVDEYTGSGIGLALCRRIVERHGGEIWVDSEPGEGSTFSVTLPSNVETATSPGAEVQV